MRNPRLLTVSLATASMLAVSGIAFAVVQSVDSSPAPQVVIPASASHDKSATPEPSDDSGKAGKGADDPATHDANDDHGGTTSTGGGGTDDSTTSDSSGGGDSGSGSGSSGGHGSDG